MTDPKETHDEAGQDDELGLKAETIADLDLEDKEGEQVRGGCYGGSCYTSRPG